MADPVNIGTRRELFVDDFIIESITHAKPYLHDPIRREVVFQVEQPFENACTGCYNFTRADGKILVYYRGFYPIGEKGADLGEQQTTNLLTSDDGINFERPSLGLVEGGARNVLHRGIKAHNFCVFLDEKPGIPHAERFKAVGGVGKDSLYGFTSGDGLTWSNVRETPLDVTGAFDSVNVAMWDPAAACYRLFSRYFHETADGGVRAIQSCTSDDFIHWTEPVPHNYLGDLPLEHFYTNATVPCPGAEHILLSFPMRFLPKRTLTTDGMDYPGTGLSDAVFMSSRDGNNWTRAFPEAWLRPGSDQRNWTHRSCTPAVGLFETGDDEWSMYVSENYGWHTNRMRRITVRPHGFASIRAGYHGGEMTTKPLVFGGTNLHLNYATSAAGSIAVEVQDAEGHPIEGYTLDDSEVLYGDTLDGRIRWRNESDIAGLAGTTVRFRFVLNDADLFAFRTDGTD